MKNILLILVCSFCVFTSYSQNGELPPVSFPSGTNVCDNSPWQLVLYDEFTGTQLNSNWITFKSFAGMHGGENKAGT